MSSLDLSTADGFMDNKVKVVFFAVVLVILLLMLMHLAVISKPIRNAMAVAGSEHYQQENPGNPLVTSDNTLTRGAGTSGSGIRLSSQQTGANQADGLTDNYQDYKWLTTAPDGYARGAQLASKKERLVSVRQDPAFFTIDPLLEAYQFGASSSDDTTASPSYVYNGASSASTLAPGQNAGNLQAPSTAVAPSSSERMGNPNKFGQSMLNWQMKY